MDTIKRYIELLQGKTFEFDFTYHSYDVSTELDFLTNLYGSLKIIEMRFMEASAKTGGYYIMKVNLIGKYFFPTAATEGDILEHYEEEAIDYIFKRLYHRMGLNRVIIYVNKGKIWYFLKGKLYPAHESGGKIAPIN